MTMKRYTLIAAIVTTCVLFTGGCKDDHSGHDHGTDAHQPNDDHQHHEGDGHDHDKPAVNSGDTDKNREVQP
jgi:hypothetical protein